MAAHTTVDLINASLQAGANNGYKASEARVGKGSPNGGRFTSGGSNSSSTDKNAPAHVNVAKRDERIFVKPKAAKKGGGGKKKGKKGGGGKGKAKAAHKIPLNPKPRTPPIGSAPMTNQTVVPATSPGGGVPLRYVGPPGVNGIKGKASEPGGVWVYSDGYVYDSQGFQPLA